ncbi:alpha/beta hydrolase [Zhihengliuella halotolerans]|uniref:Alpha-beta hydrolase superfamily lysophospholipase n=1 Tax=Zhihengliuella halotolerans TaxID=370736 RepID=A0A4Q8AH42_9MICC|nr:alpha/beta hydrolase [Zhihengliuella halotolerans]RZU63702.1 alpha-beta hydrolase superfamily lysophospholipase [Zhihengliuella halotolerans]
MSTSPDCTPVDGTLGRISVWRWAAKSPRFITVIAHGYGEHARRYDHVAERLLAVGAEVFAPDHFGHGSSEGERVLIERFDDYAIDLENVVDRAREQHPGLPVVLIGHSMGGAISTRYIQRAGPGALSALVLSGPLLGGSPLVDLLQHDPLPDVPIDTEGLSRDPATGRAYLEDPLVHHGSFRRETLLAIRDALDDVAAGPDFAGLPTLWLHGEDDPIVPFEPAGRVVPRLIGEAGRRKSYPGARHEIFNETNRDEVIEDAIAFIDAAVSARG